MHPRIIVIGATGWYGKTIVYEYIQKFGFESARQNLLLYASRSNFLSFRHGESGREIQLRVFSLADSLDQSFDDYDGLIWLSFLLKSKLAFVGLDEYVRINNSIAETVFNILSSNPHLSTIFFSSGAALGLDKHPSLESDPYAYLKIIFERKLSQMTQLCTFYPYATLGKFVPDNSMFAAASFIRQALTTGIILINAKMPVVRSYGSVHDFSRLLLQMYENKDWCSNSFPAKIVPVSHTLDLFQLACEVSAALDKSLPIVNNFPSDSPPSVYVTSDFSYGSQLSRFGIKSTDLRQQLIDMASADAFKMSTNTI